MRTRSSLISGLIDQELSEPYSVFTYRYFLNNWSNCAYGYRRSDVPVRRCHRVQARKAPRDDARVRGHARRGQARAKAPTGSELVRRALEVM